jgi:dGTPase
MGEKDSHNLIPDFSRLATPDSPPWSVRAFQEPSGDPRSSFDRDRDRILHSDSLRKLQHKTQVFVVHEGDFFRTRLTHTLEVAQIGRTIARVLCLNETLVEAIALAHDLGHPPFGHAGESALSRLLKDRGSGWNANINSLDVVQERESQYFTHRGLNVTWATREGIARHKTKFDEPSEDDEFSRYRQPSLETQVVNVADVVAYAAHDVEDALVARILDTEELESQKIELWNKCWNMALEESQKTGSTQQSTGIDTETLVIRRTRRHLIDHLIRDIWHEAGIRAENVRDLNEARSLDQPLIAFTPKVASDVETLLNFMMDRVYRSPLVARQNYRATHIITQLFNALEQEPSLLPVWARPAKASDVLLNISRFIASLTDRTAADLYAELFVATERSMGHRI